MQSEPALNQPRLLPSGRAAPASAGGSRLAFLLVMAALLATFLLPSAHAQTLTLAVSPTSVDEGSPATDVVVTATLSPAQATPTTVTLSISGDALAGTDYRELGTLPTITIAANQTEASATLVLAPIDDDLWEGPEGIEIGGTTAGGVRASPATLALADNDTKPSIFISLDPSFTRHTSEDSTTASTVRVRAEFRGGSPVSVDTRVSIQVSGGTVGTDYNLSPQAPLITIPAGRTDGTTDVSITPIDNDDIGRHIELRFNAQSVDRFGVSFMQLPAANNDNRFIIVDDDTLTRLTTTLIPDFARESQTS